MEYMLELCLHINAGFMNMPAKNADLPNIA